MIVDTSAVVAILRKQTEAFRFADLLANTERSRLSAASYLEAAIVIDGSHNHVTSQQGDIFTQRSFWG